MKLQMLSFTQSLTILLTQEVQEDKTERRLKLKPLSLFDQLPSMKSIQLPVREERLKLMLWLEILIKPIPLREKEESLEPFPLFTLKLL